jgi:two-component system nitrate/nitrite response regulator NarL
MREGLDIIRDVRSRSEATRVLAFAVDDTSSDLIACAEAGAAGYVAPDVSFDGLVDAIERVARNELVCSPRAAAQLFKRISEPREPDGPGLKDLSRLTTREAEVLDFISEGSSNKEIAAALNISESTVKNHVHHVLEKLAVTTRAQAAVRALRHLGRQHTSRFATVRPANRGSRQ